MKPVLYVINCLSVGGAQKALLNLLESPLREAYQPTVLALVRVQGIQQQFEAAGIPVQVLDVKSLMGLLLLPWRLWRAVRQVRPAVIHGWQYHGNWVATVAWWLAGCHPRLLWGIHHTPDAATFQRWQHALVLWLGRWLSRCPDTIVYVSRRSAHRHAELGYAVKRVVVVANGMPLLPTLPTPDKPALRAALGIRVESPVIGSLTRFVPAKAIPNLVEAIRLFRAAGHQACFVLAGEGMSPDNAALQSLLVQAECQDVVVLLGVRSDAMQVVQAMDIATLASSREAFPLFLAEAMAAGIPCVATDVGDIAECVGDTGLVVPKENPAQLAAAWARLLALPEADRLALGQKANSRIRQHYGMDKVVAVYQRLLAGGGLVEGS